MNILYPILVFLGLLAIPAVLIMRFVNGRNKHIRNKRFGKILLGSYFAIILISVIVYELLPVQASDIQPVNEEETEKITVKLYDAIFNGRTEEIDPAYIKDKWTLDYEGTELKIFQAEGFFEGEIVVERKPKADGKIEGAYYGSTIVGGVDMTKEISPPRIKLNGDNLEIIGTAGIVHLDYTFAKKEFVINQFTGENFIQTHFDGFRNFQMLYLRIPSNLELINRQDLPIHYVGE